MSLLASAIRKPAYVLRLEANLPSEDQTLVTYRNLGKVASGPHIVDLQLPIIGRQVEGAAGR